MTRKKISQLIEKAINVEWSISNFHGCDLKKCLIRPKKRKLRFGSEIKTVWIVLEENIEKLEGYKAFFDAENFKFGLAEYSIPSSDVHITKGFRSMSRDCVKFQPDFVQLISQKPKFRRVVF